MRLTSSLSGTASTFKLIETAINKLHIASMTDEDSSDTANFLLKKMDAEAATLETDTNLKHTCRNLRSELENRGVQCATYRFHKDGSFGGYTLCLSGLLEDEQPIGNAYVHVTRRSNSIMAATSLFYRSPYKSKTWTVVSKSGVSDVWRILSNLGYDKPKTNLLELDIKSFIAREDVHGSAKCVDLKEGASLAIAERIRRTLGRTYRTTQVVESNNRYTVIAKNPK